MNSRSLGPASDVCWACRYRLTNSRRRIDLAKVTRDGFASPPGSRLPTRTFHDTRLRPQFESTLSAPEPPIDPTLLRQSSQQQVPIRQRLQKWQQEFGGPSEATLKAFENHPARGNIQNGLSKLRNGAKADEELGENELDPEEDNDGSELITIGLFLKPGDVVELSQTDREPVLAVFVQQMEGKSQFYSVNGRWCHTILARISFAIPGCIDPVLLQPLIPFLPTKPNEAAPKGEIHVPRDLGAPIQRVLEGLKEEAERIYRQNAAVLDTAYSVLADPHRARMMTLTQITKTLLGRNEPLWKPSPSALLAVRKALNHNEYRFSSDPRSQRLTNVFAIRPKNDVEVVETVQEWVREFREDQASSATVDSHDTRVRSKESTYVAEFVEKARQLALNSRKDREPNYGTVGPSKFRFPITETSSATRATFGEEFTSTDKQIISFLQAWVLTQGFKNMPSLHSACASIIRATGCYEDSIQNLPREDPHLMSRSTGQLFLQEIGVIMPHENRVLYDEQLMLPTVRPTRNLELLNTKAELTRRSPDFRDSMAEFRRDWGIMNVYCIDAADAKEIDDGISISKIEDESEYWIHVHVANPTAFFDKTHVLSGLAAHMTQTVYTPERSFPMLPAWVTQGYFSLGSNRPVITFSSRVNLSGNILETKIQHGIVRKVINMTPVELSSALGESVNTKGTKFVVGGDVPSAKLNRPTPKLTSYQLQELHDLGVLAKALWQSRKAAGAIRMPINNNEVRLFENSPRPGLTWTPPSTGRARLIQGDPIIELTTGAVQRSIQEGINASNIVEEMMIMACRSTASWCAERNIPVMYRGTVETPSSEDLSLEQFKKDVIAPYIVKHGALSTTLGFRYLGYLGRSITHSSPLPHKIIGVPSYLRVTSPLRRFSDMIAHWQIEGALRHEARTGQKFDAADVVNAPRQILPFSQRQMQESIITLSPREKIIRQTQDQSTHFWIVQAFIRAFHYKETALPETFRVWIRTVGANHFGAGGYMSDFSITVHLVEREGVTYEIGDEWEVRLHSLDAYGRCIFVAPIQLLHRETGLA